MGQKQASSKDLKNFNTHQNVTKSVDSNLKEKRLSQTQAQKFVESQNNQQQ